MSANSYWFPMRVTYNREMKVKEHFDNLGVECFLPMRSNFECTEGQTKEELVPAIHNLLFVHSTQDELTKLKMYDKRFSALRYMMKKEDGRFEIMTISDKEMDNFIRVASVSDNSIFYLDNKNESSYIGKRVRIKAGRFEDVVGVIKRIKRNRHVVVRIEGVAAVAIAYIPFSYLEEVSD